MPTGFGSNLALNSMKHTGAALKFFARLISTSVELYLITIFHEIFGLNSIKVKLIRNSNKVFEQLNKRGEGYDLYP